MGNDYYLIAPNICGISSICLNQQKQKLSKVKRRVLLFQASYKHLLHKRRSLLAQKQTMSDMHGDNYVCYDENYTLLVRNICLTESFCEDLF